MLILRRRPMMGVDLGLGRGHHNVICGEQRLYQHIILLSTHYLYQHINLLWIHSLNIMQSLEISSKSEPFSETLMELFCISAGLLRQYVQHFNEMSRLLQYCLQMIDLEGCTVVTTAQKSGFSGDRRCRGSTGSLGIGRISFLSPLIGLGCPR